MGLESLSLWQKLKKFLYESQLQSLFNSNLKFMQQDKVRNYFAHS